MKSKKTLIISGVIATIVIIAIIIGVLYFTTDLFKTEQQLFYKYIAETQIMDLEFINQYNVANEKIIKNSSSSVGEMKVMTNIANQENGLTETQEILKISSNGLKNTLLKQSYRDFTFSSNNQNFLTLKYLKDDNTYGIIADNILVKYLAIENTNLKDFFSKLGVTDTSTIPDSIPTNYEEILKIDEVTINQLKETYGTLIYNNINEENFYKISNADKTQTIGLSLTEQETFDILRITLETAKNDSTLLNLIVSKAQLIGYTDITIENMQTEIQTYIDKISNQVYSNNEEFINLSFIKKDNSVIKLIFMINEIIETEDMMLEEGSTVNLPEVSTLAIEMDISEKQKVVFSVLENDIELIKSVISYLYNNENISFNIELESKEGEQTNYIKTQYQINNYQTDNIIQNFIVDINYNNEENYQFNLSNNIILKQDVQISKLTTENSVKLNDMTQEELGILFTALMNRINTTYNLQNNNLIMQ